MMPPTRLLLVSLTGCLVGCGSHVRPAQPAPPPSSLPVTSVLSAPIGTPVPLRADPHGELIARAEAEFEAGQAELAHGRLVAARSRFDAAVDLLLQVQEGARSSPRLAQAYDQLLDRVTALDVIALRDGDGFTETRSEPAAIDELLTAAMLDDVKPAAT